MRRNALGHKALLVVLAIFTAFVVPAMSWFAMASPGDLSLLAPYAAQCNYAQLIDGLHAGQPPADTFSFVVFGDSRNNVFVAEKVFKQAAREQPDLIFHTGDLIRGGTVQEYLDNYLPLLEETDPVPVFAVPGNHERGDRRDFAAYHALFGGERFSFDYGPCRFVGFNASEKIRVTGSELAWLDAELSKPGVEYKFVFFHIPPAYFEDAVIGDDDPRGFTWKAEELREILVRNNVDEVFMGHIHGYASTILDGVRYTLSAGAGAPLSERLPEERRKYHLLVVHVSPEGLSQELVRLQPGSLDWRREPVY